MADDDVAARATRFGDDLLAALRDGSDVSAMSTDIDTLGARAVDAVAKAAAAALTGSPRSETTAITGGLADLQGLAQSLSPTADLSDPAVADRYFDGFRRHQPELAATLDVLRLGREHLDREQARLADTATTVRTAITALTRYTELAAGIDERLAATTLANPAEQTRQDLLFAVRQRRQDLLTQTAVAEQLALSLAITRRNNAELAAAVRRAIECTVTALAVAVAAAQAVSSRRLVLDQVAAAHDVGAAAERAADAIATHAGTSLDLDADGSSASLSAAFAELDDALGALDRAVHSASPAPVPTAGGHP